MRERYQRQSRDSSRSLSRAAESFVALQGSLAGICDKPKLSALSAAIGEFDFDGARKKLEEIIRDYGANWELSK